MKVEFTLRIIADTEARRPLGIRQGLQPHLSVRSRVFSAFKLTGRIFLLNIGTSFHVSVVTHFPSITSHVKWDC